MLSSLHPVSGRIVKPDLCQNFASKAMGDCLPSASSTVGGDTPKTVANGSSRALLIVLGEVDPEPGPLHSCGDIEKYPLGSGIFNRRPTIIIPGKAGRNHFFIFAAQGQLPPILLIVEAVHSRTSARGDPERPTSASYMILPPENHLRRSRATVQ